MCEIDCFGILSHFSDLDLAACALSTSRAFDCLDSSDKNQISGFRGL